VLDARVVPVAAGEAGGGDAPGARGVEGGAGGGGEVSPGVTLVGAGFPEARGDGVGAFGQRNLVGAAVGGDLLDALGGFAAGGGAEAGVGESAAVEAGEGDDVDA
jgi:hypothetical protein